MTDRPDEEPVRGARRKKTQRWCRGKKGREHQPVIQPSHHRLRNDTPVWYHRVCSACGKILEYMLDQHGNKISIRHALGMAGIEVQE